MTDDPRVARATAAARKIGVGDEGIAVMRAQMIERVAHGEQVRAMLGTSRIHNVDNLDFRPAVFGPFLVTRPPTLERTDVEFGPDGVRYVEYHSDTSDDGLAAARGIGRAFLFWGAIVAIVALAFAIGRVTSDPSGRVRSAVHDARGPQGNWHLIGDPFEWLREVWR